MPSPIVETASLGDAINAPVGADARTAASVRTPFQAVGNRLKFWEEKWEGLKAWILGGTVSPGGAVNVEADLSSSGTLSAVALTASTGPIQGKRRLRVDAPTGNATYNSASGIDCVVLDRSNIPSGTTTITIQTSGYSTGDVIWVVIGATFSASVDLVIDIAIIGSGAITVSDSVTNTAYLFMRVSGGWRKLAGP